jgi:anti-sigma-K factor RskA
MPIVRQVWTILATVCAAAAFVVAVPQMGGCATDPATGKVVAVAPKSPTQSVYVLEISLTAATNAIADLHTQGILVGPNYERAKVIEAQAHATLIDARNAAMAQDATRSQVYLTTLASLIEQLAAYNGGVR